VYGNNKIRYPTFDLVLEFCGGLKNLVLESPKIGAGVLILLHMHYRLRR